MNGLVGALICGPREGSGIDMVWYALDEARRHPDIPRFNMVIVGSNRGTDYEAWLWAMKHELPALVYPAKWNTGRIGGRPEGPVRNREMYCFSGPRVALGFPGNRGTKDMMDVVTSGRTPSWWWSRSDGLWVLDERCGAGR